jgi:hypothetical protein
LQERKVRHVSVHPAFNDANLHNDYALLHLTEDFDLAPHINVVCLPTDEHFDDFIKEECVAAGWGKDSVGKNALESVLYHILRKCSSASFMHCCLTDNIISHRY